MLVIDMDGGVVVVVVVLVVGMREKESGRVS